MHIITFHWHVGACKYKEWKHNSSRLSKHNFICITFSLHFICAREYKGISGSIITADCRSIILYKMIIISLCTEQTIQLSTCFHGLLISVCHEVLVINALLLCSIRQQVVLAENCELVLVEVVNVNIMENRSYVHSEKNLYTNEE